MVAFRSVEPGSKHRRTIQFQAHGATEASLPSDFEAVVSSPEVVATVGQAATSRTPEGAFVRTVPIDLDLTVPSQANVAPTTLTVRFRQGEQSVMESVGIHWQARQPVTVSPTQVLFRITPGKATDAKRVLLRSDGAAVNVTRVTTAPGIRAEVSQSAPGTVIIAVSVDEDTVETGIFDLWIETDTPNATRLRVPVAISRESAGNTPNPEDGR